jgi:hypothetical protein
MAVPAHVYTIVYTLYRVCTHRCTRGRVPEKRGPEKEPTGELHVRGKLTVGWTFQKQLYELKAARGASPPCILTVQEAGCAAAAARERPSAGPREVSEHV